MGVALAVRIGVMVRPSEGVIDGEGVVVDVEVGVLVLVEVLEGEGVFDKVGLG